MAYRAVGPAFLLIGDPTTASGADMYNFVDVEDVRVDVNLQTGYGSSAALAGAPSASAVYALPAQPRIQASVQDADLDQIAALILGVDTNTQVRGGTDRKTIGFGDSFRNITPPTICVIPAAEKNDGIFAPHAVWLPACIVQNLTDLLHNRPTPDEINNPFSVEFMSAYREEDQDGDDIPEHYRLGWMGPPGGVEGGPLSWSVPDL